MANHATAIHEIMAALDRRQLAVVTGAGTSVGKPSCVPLFRPLRDALFGALFERARPMIAADIQTEIRILLSDRRAGTPEPLPEVLFATLRRHFDTELWDALRLMLHVQHPNAVHLTLVSLMGRGLRLVITTNFDEGIERAAEASNVRLTVCDAAEALIASAADGSLELSAPNSGTLWKVHGSITAGREHSIAVTLDEIARESVDLRKAKAIVEAVRGCSILVMGYSGNDPDLVDALIAAAPAGNHLVWVLRDSNARTRGASRVLEAWAGKVTVEYGDAEVLMRALASNVGVPLATSPSAIECLESLGHRQQALTVWAEGRRLYDALGALASLSHYLGEFGLALKLGDLRQRFQATTDLGTAWATLAKAEILKDAARFDERDALIRGLVQVTQTWRIVHEAWPNELMQFQGYLFRHVGSMLTSHDAGAARRAYEAGLVKAGGVGDRALERALLHDIGVLSARTGDFATAREQLKRSAEMAQAAGDVRMSIRSAHELAVCAMELGEREDAIRTLEENCALARQHGDLAVELPTHFELVVCLLKASRLSEQDIAACNSALQRGSLLGRYLKQKRARFGLAVYRAKLQLMVGRSRNARRILSVLERHATEMNLQDVANVKYLAVIAGQIIDGQAVIFLPEGKVALYAR